VLSMELVDLGSLIIGKSGMWGSKSGVPWGYWGSLLGLAFSQSASLFDISLVFLGFLVAVLRLVALLARCGMPSLYELQRITASGTNDR